MPKASAPASLFPRGQMPIGAISVPRGALCSFGNAHSEARPCDRARGRARFRFRGARAVDAPATMRGSSTLRDTLRRSLRPGSSDRVSVRVRVAQRDVGPDHFRAGTRVSPRSAPRGARASRFRVAGGAAIPARASSSAPRAHGGSGQGRARFEADAPFRLDHERKICSSRSPRSSSRISAARSKSSSFAAARMAFSSSVICRAMDGASGRSGRESAGVGS